VIGSKGDSGAVLFGTYSFLDKISSGIIISMLANLPYFSNKPILEADELMLKAPVVGICSILRVEDGKSIFCAFFNSASILNNDLLQ
jgi:hypothetical protein